MSIRYQLIKNPKTTFYETPAQAYMIINGISEVYQLSKITRKRNARSLNCKRHYQTKGQQEQQPTRYCFEHDPHRKQRRTRMKSCDHNLIKQRKRLKDLQHDNYQQQKNYFHNEYNLRPNNANRKQRAVSFQNLNLADHHKQINCNYSQQIENQNMELRKQNKALQNYVKTLQSYCIESDENVHRTETQFRKYRPPFRKKNSFTSKNAVDNSEKTSEIFQFFGNKMQQTKGLTEWHSYLN